MKKSTLLFKIAICVCFIVSKLHAQNKGDTADSLIQKINFYGLKKQSSVLFVHFDKTVYINNENVWFTAYLLNYDKKTNNPSILSVVLVNDNDRSIALEQQFVMADGLAFGNVFIPDSISAGDFSFIIYTNELISGKPRDVFTQPITIKSTAEPSFLASLNLIDTIKLPADGFTKVVLKATTRDSKPLSGAKVIYHVGDSQHPVTSGTVKTDKDGQYLFSLPVNKILAGGNVLEAQINVNKDYSDLKIVLPVSENKLNIKFYPEGGNLIHATQSTVGWEAKSADGSPRKVTGLLLKDNQVIDTIETDSYGIGKFKLIPLMGSIYNVRLLGDAKDSTYMLPGIRQKGPVISIKNALANDTLRIRLTSKYPGTYYLIVHNYHQVFFSFPAEAGAAGKLVLVNLKDIPKGLNTITVLDNLQRPCCERLFFAHYDKRSVVNINTDKPSYLQREKIHVKLKLEAPKDDSLKGVVSVACVQSNRIELKKSNDIESYLYLKNDLGSLPLKDKYIGEKQEERDYLEKILLIKGWTNYSWSELRGTSSKDTVIDMMNVNSLEGSVLKYGKALKKPIKILLITDSVTTIVTTNKNGEFSLDRNKIIIANNKKGHLLLENNSYKEYTLSFKNQFSKISTSLARDFTTQQYNYFLKNVITQSSLAMTGMQHVINLREVKIKALKDEGYSQTVNINGLANANNCGDYVCKFNILNCPNHRFSNDNRPAVKGEQYIQIAGGKAINIIYTGCQDFNFNPGTLIVTFNGINYAKEFYGSDYSKYNPPEPEYLSTIYWKHLCLVNSKGDVDLSFYSSDITGPFKIVVQGITQNDVIYGEKQIEVKK